MYKAASGAIEYINIFEVSNINSTLKNLKEKNFWVYGFDGNGKKDFTDGLRASFENGWALLRASNTTPKLVLRFEANSQESLEEIQKNFGVVPTTVTPLNNFLTGSDIEEDQD